MLNFCGKNGAFGAVAAKVAGNAVAKVCLAGLVLMAAVLGGCNEEKRGQTVVEKVQLDFQGHLFLVDTVAGERVAAIRSIVGSDTLEKVFVLRDSAAFAVNKPLPQGLAGAMVLRTPLQRVAVLSSAQIGYMLRLGLDDRIVAVGAGKYIADSALYYRVEVSSSIAEVSPDGMNVDYEKLIALKPDLVMTFATGGSQDDYDRMEKLGIPVMLTSEWQENSLDAKAEWLWLYDALFGGNGKLEKMYGLAMPMALSKYRELKQDADTLNPCVNQKFVRERAFGKRDSVIRFRGPRVLAGMSYGGVWYAPGGRSYTADLIRRAGGCYLWSSDTTRELKLTIEDVMVLADSADIWINPGMFGTPEEILAAEPRAAHIKAFKNKKVFQNDGRKGPGGGNDFFESAVARPDDLVDNLNYLFSESVNGREVLLISTSDLRLSGNNHGNVVRKTDYSSKPTFAWYHNIF